ncbi:hypothetical protein FH972_007594 [Carpinus fangiana]|uniref:Uncharacterized protein n=1 Tax=Carpinus fangiana TaxID=176857 RepID=A0A5N6QWY5_9ROSI|nr:hypothetical protein FH972_007594 [Carpinus fangiana]
MKNIDLTFFCVLLAFILFSSVIARDLAQSGTDQTENHNNLAAAAKPGTGTGGTADPNKPQVCDPKSPTYSRCASPSKPKPKCDPSSKTHERCPPEDP